MRSNKIKYSTSTGLYCTVHDVMVPFKMPYFYSIKIISHQYHVGNNEGESVVGYYMIIVRDLMVLIGRLYDFNRQVLQWNSATVPMKEPRGIRGQIDKTSCKMCEVVMQTKKSVNTREAT